MTRTDEQRHEHARAVNLWRLRNPESYRATKDREMAKRRALVRLGERYPDELAALLAEETWWAQRRWAVSQ